jgi:hypothetical protein
MMNVDGLGREVCCVVWKGARAISVGGPGTSDRDDEGTGQPEGDGDRGLEDAARDEREYVRERLREELGREPAQEELDEWLRRHTEGY